MSAPENNTNAQKGAEPAETFSAAAQAGEQFTDAALIAAAPDLLAALLDFVAASEAIASGDTSMNLPWGTARAAIAKARDTQ